MQTLEEVRLAAIDSLYAGDYDRALHGFAALVRLQPQHLPSRLRLGDTLLAMGEVQGAARVYTALARHCTHAGYPLYALVALKLLTALEPQLGSLVSSLAELYAEDSERLGRSTRLAFGDLKISMPDGADLSLTPPRADLIQVATAVGEDFSAIAAYPEAVPPIPLFSSLQRAGFTHLLSAMKLKRVRPFEVIVEQGQEGVAGYVLARGSVEIRRTSAEGEVQTLASLHDGAVFGEVALIRRQKRAATVVAKTDCDLLVFERDVLEAADIDGVVRQGLDRYMRERLLQNLLGTAALFKPLSPAQRNELLKRFTAHDVPKGTVMIRQGQVGDGLYVILHGEAVVTKQEGAAELTLATLEAGDVFGEISLIQDEPTIASVMAASDLSLLFLGRDIFSRLVAAVPGVRDYIEELGTDRLLSTQRTLSERPPAGDFDASDWLIPL